MSSGQSCPSHRGLRWLTSKDRGPHTPESQLPLLCPGISATGRSCLTPKAPRARPSGTAARPPGRSGGCVPKGQGVSRGCVSPPGGCWALRDPGQRARERTGKGRCLRPAAWHQGCLPSRSALPGFQNPGVRLPAEGETESQRGHPGTPRRAVVLGRASGCGRKASCVRGVRSTLPEPSARALQ